MQNYFLSVKYYYTILHHQNPFKLKKIICLLTACFSVFILSSCKKSSNDNAAIVASLSKTCAHPIAGLHADSMLITLPTAFTPNGDGRNDLYHIIKTSGTLSNFQMTIYQLDGTQVFQFTDPNGSWLGKDQNGNACTNYKYYVKLKFTTSHNTTIDTGTFVYLLQKDPSKGCIHTVEADKASYTFEDQTDPYTGGTPAPTGENLCP